MAAQPLDQLYVSVVTFAEIRFGIELVTHATRRAALQDWLKHRVRPMLAQRVPFARGLRRARRYSATPRGATRRTPHCTGGGSLCLDLESLQRLTQLATQLWMHSPIPSRRPPDGMLPMHCVLHIELQTLLSSVSLSALFV